MEGIKEMNELDGREMKTKIEGVGRGLKES